MASRWAFFDKRVYLTFQRTIEKKGYLSLDSIVISQKGKCSLPLILLKRVNEIKKIHEPQNRPVPISFRKGFVELLI